MRLDPLLVFIIAPALMALVLVCYALPAIKKKRWLGLGTRVLGALLLLSLSALAMTLSVATAGYYALTHEALAATVQLRQLGDQRYSAIFSFPDGSQQAFELAGDQFSVEANIVKWHPFANILGLHTHYRLERVAGRYDILEHEQTRPRTVYALAQAASWDVLELKRHFAPLETLVDAEYGSATFAAAQELATYHIYVSTTGLLVRSAN